MNLNLLRSVRDRNLLTVVKDLVQHSRRLNVCAFSDVDPVGSIIRRDGF